MDKKLELFADWVLATHELFAAELVEDSRENILSFLQVSMAKRKQVLSLRADRKWSVAALHEAEAMTSGIGAVLYVGLNSFFGDAAFDLDEYRAVKARLFRAAWSG